MTDLDEDVVEEDAIAEHYDYYSDSDLEDAEGPQATGDSDDTHATTDGSQDAARYFRVSSCLFAFLI